MKRIIYVYEFPDKTAYVGLTKDIKKRDSQRRSHSYHPVNKYSQESGLHPELRTLTDFIEDIEEARKSEIKFIDQYKKEGWNLLNKRKGGEIGASIFWNKERCTKEASRYRVLHMFEFWAPGAYRKAKVEGWIDEICSHMPNLSQAPEPMTKEKYKAIASKHVVRSILKEYEPKIYNIIKENGWLEEFFGPAMTPQQRYEEARTEHYGK